MLLQRGFTAKTMLDLGGPELWGLTTRQVQDRIRGIRKKQGTGE